MSHQDPDPNSKTPDWMGYYTLAPTLGRRHQRHPRGIVGRLFRVNNPSTVQIGDCWMAGRLLAGDLILCVRHSGDCFQDYILVKEYANGIEGIPGSCWGAYGYGDSTPSRTTLTRTQAASVSAGEFVELEMGMVAQGWNKQPCQNCGELPDDCWCDHQHTPY